MTNPHPRRLLVLGVSDSEAQRLNVSFPKHEADSIAKVVDLRRGFTYWVSPQFAVDAFSEQPPPPAFVWLAEFEVGSHPGLGLIRWGAQASPLLVRARYLLSPDTEAAGADNGETERPFDELPIEPGYDLGALMVHGIGAQLTTDTLREWSTALQRWIDVFLEAAMTPVARRLDLKQLRQWETSIRVRPSLEAIDEDHVERSALATRFVRAAESLPEALRGDDDLRDKAARLLSELGFRDLTAEERAGRDAVDQCNEQGIRAAAFAGSAIFTSASLLDPGRSPNEPANAELRIETLAPDGYVQRSQWLLAEAHWAETFRAPDLAEFAHWAARAGPIAFIYYFGMRVRRTKRPWFASAHFIVPLAAVAALMETLMLVLLVVAVVPIPWVRKRLSKLERALTGVLGDSYVFVSDDLQRRAILERMRRDMRWLLARCRKVVVVAHSQGAAVTHRALARTSQGQSEKLDSIVSLGSGMKILDTLEEYIDDPVALRAGWAAIVGVIALFAADPPAGP